MKDRFKFRVVLKTDTHSIITKPYYILGTGYLVNIDDVQKSFEKKYPDDCFWEFAEEIEKQENCQEVSTDSEIIIFDSFDGLIQSTGLKDKNGKLVYEGDIVKCAKWDLAARDSFRDDEYIEQVGVINYYNNRCKFVVNYTTTASNNEIYLPETSLGILGDCHIEVIGNVYENPELLEVKND